MGPSFCYDDAGLVGSALLCSGSAHVPTVVSGDDASIVDDFDWNSYPIAYGCEALGSTRIADFVVDIVLILQCLTSWVNVRDGRSG